tara:strand:+ start:3573 stop:4586 length:1014 start_codon:yes stop_codon:yes gene_type:complete
LGFIVARAPFRLSFAGGGTDLPSFYNHNTGEVVSTTINKYVYVIINSREHIFGKGIDDPFSYKFRLSYSNTENVHSADEISHPIVREALKLLDIDEPLDIATMADIPAGTGLGSSGTFSVSLLHALHTYKGEELHPQQLAEEAAHIEINLLNRPVGKQDHYAAAFGGLNTYRFNRNGTVEVDPLNSNPSTTQSIFEALLLLNTGISRASSSVLDEQNSNTENNREYLLNIKQHAEHARRIIKSGFDVEEFGQLLNNTWQQKRKLATNISTNVIDDWYDKALNSGAIGGKICGAGGGGFLLLVINPELRTSARNALKDLANLEIKYEPMGSEILISTS